MYILLFIRSCIVNLKLFRVVGNTLRLKPASYAELGKIGKMLHSVDSMGQTLSDLIHNATASTAALKHGAFSFQASPISRLILFTSNSCSIFARMNSIVVFMYFGGPGQIYPDIAFIIFHSLFMGALHFNFSTQMREKRRRSSNRMSNLKPIYRVTRKKVHQIFMGFLPKSHDKITYRI